VEVTVKLVSILKKYSSVNSQNDEITLFLKDSAKIYDLIKELKIPPDTPLLILKNGSYADIHTELQPDDKITILPPVSGG
jgi:sulfur carrier protein ThiS